MRRSCSWLWKRVTAERLAVAVFLAVAVGLWWGMPPRPEQVITIPTDGYYPGAFLISPDGTLCLVQETPDRDYGYFSRVHGLRVFDLGTGQEIWQWHSSVNPIQHVTWTKQNRLFFFVADLKQPKISSPLLGLGGHILGFDPRHGKEPVFHHHNPYARATKFCYVTDSNTLMIRHLMGNGTPRFERVDLLSGTITTSVLPISEYWSNYDLISPDGSSVLYWRPQKESVTLQLYDIQSGRLLQQFPTTCKLHTHYGAAFSPDGRLLAACEDAKGLPDRVRVWDVLTGKLVATLEGLHTNVPAREAKGKICFLCVNELRFLGNGSLLCIGTDGAAYDPQGNQLWNLNVWRSACQVFDTQTFQRLPVNGESSSARLSSDGRYLTVERQRQGDDGVILHDLQLRREVFHPSDWWRVRDRFGFADSRAGVMHYVMAVKPEVTTRNDPAWMLRVRGWLGLSNEEPARCDLTLRQLPEGTVSDQLSFPAEDAIATPIPVQNQLLVHLRLGNNQERLELYSLPPRRPWLHIFGWALVAGAGVELLGLGWRRVRRPKAEHATSVVAQPNPEC